ncbi:MAG: carboxypeptidase-like regulatory domain-containing protein [Planctomycetota bacterium]
MRILTVLSLVSLVAAVLWVNLLGPEAPPETLPDGAPDPALDAAPIVVANAGEEGVPAGSEHPQEPPIEGAAPEGESATVVVVAPPSVQLSTGAPGAKIATPPPVAEAAEEAPEAREAPTVEPEGEPAEEPEERAEERAAEEEPAGVLLADPEPIVPPSRGRQLVGQVLDSTGQGLSRVQVLLTDRDDIHPTRTATSDVNGIFVASGIPAGRYLLAVAPHSVPGHIARPAAVGLCRTGTEPYGFGSVCVDLADDSQVTTVEVTLPFASEMRGRVFGVDGLPGRGALVRAVSRVAGFERVNELVRVDEQGRFAFRLVPGPYDVEVYAHGLDEAKPSTCILRLDAEEAAILVVDDVDFSRPADIEERTRRSARERELEARASSEPAPVAASVGLSGRVATRVGEPVEGLTVTCLDAEGRLVGRATSDATGAYTFPSVPVGPATIEVGPSTQSVETRPRLRRWTEPLELDLDGVAMEVEAPDLIVEVERAFHVRGRIVVDAATLDAFRAQLAARDPAMDRLPTSRIQRAFLRGMRLTVRPVGEAPGTSRSRVLLVDADGSFAWSTPLPGEDVVFRLEPRSARQGAIYDGPVERAVSPIGVRTADVELIVPAESRLAER